MQYKPQHYSLVSGIGKSQYRLSAFDNALLDAGIVDYNLMKVSSILPSNCKYCEKIPIGKGDLLYTAYSTITLNCNEYGMTGVAVAIPSVANESGVIFETSYVNQKTDIKIMLKEMCQNAMRQRGRNLLDIKYSCQEVKGESNIYVSAISAVVMW